MDDRDRPRQPLEIEWRDRCGRCGRKFRPPFWTAENDHAGRPKPGIGRTGLTLLSGFEGIDGGKATTPEDSIDSLHCQVMYLRALIKRNPPEGLIDRFRQVQARVDYGRPSLARHVGPLSGSSGAAFRHNAPAIVLRTLRGILAGIDLRRYRAQRSRACDRVGS
jgi:hypothetical protein